MRTSLVPAVLDALVERIGTATGVQVLDGPPGAADVDRDEVISVGLGVGDDEAAESTRPAPPTGLGGRDEETFTIRVGVSVVDGDGLMKQSRDRVAVILGQVELLVRGDRTLGGVCDWLSFGPRVQWAQLRTADGVEVAATAEVTGRGFL